MRSLEAQAGCELCKLTAVYGKATFSIACSKQNARLVRGPVLTEYDFILLKFLLTLYTLKRSVHTAQ
jgi:hypothetical protein